MRTIGVNRLLGSAIVLALAVSAAGCGSNTQPADAFPTLDLAAAIDTPRPFDLGDIAGNIEFIPLDDSDREGLIDRRMLGLAESKNGWYVHDGNGRPVKFFDKTGKFVSTRGSIGRGPNEYAAVNVVVADYDNDALFVVAAGGSIVAYDTDGRMTARNDSISSFAVAWIGDRLVLVNEPRFRMYPEGMAQPAPPPGTMTTLLDLYSADLRHQGGIETQAKGTHYVATFDTVDGQMANLNIMGSPYIISGNGRTLLVKEGRSDTVFHFRNDRVLEPAYRLDLGRYNPPPAAYGTNPAVDWSRYYRVVNVWEGDRAVVVTAQKALELTPHFLIFDGDEPSKGFLALGPGGGNELTVGGVTFTPMYVRAGRLVGYIQAFDIVDNAGGITDPGLKALAATLREDSNPVIVIATLK